MPRKKTYRNENDVKAEIRKILAEHGWTHNWNGKASVYGANGQSDRMALKGGVFLAIEAKFGKNVPTVNQIKFLRDTWENGGYGIVVNETNVHKLGDFLEKIERVERNEKGRD